MAMQSHNQQLILHNTHTTITHSHSIHSIPFQCHQSIATQTTTQRAKHISSFFYRYQFAFTDITVHKSASPYTNSKKAQTHNTPSTATTNYNTHTHQHHHSHHTHTHSKHTHINTMNSDNHTNNIDVAEIEKRKKW